MKPLLLLMAPLTLGHPDDGRFAIACTGTTHTRHTMDGTEHVASGELPRQIYVIAPAANDVQRALVPRKEFEPVCSTEGGMRFVSIAPGLVTASSDQGGEPSWTCKFEVDRMTGKGSSLLRGDWANGRFHEMLWEFTCEKTEIPVFDLSRRRF
ncbi:MAG: hypothetical protein ACOY45_08295 [Pseudomonadota bacterium]